METLLFTVQCLHFDHTFLEPGLLPVIHLCSTVNKGLASEHDR